MIIEVALLFGFIKAVLVFILVIMLLVVPHELGHFTAAKLFGIRVEEFGIGFLKRLWSRKIGETEYSINLLPLGGFVKIFGEEEEVADPRSFSGRSFWVKTSIVAAGVVANVLVAYILFSALAYLGTPKFGVEVASVLPNSPAEVSGIHSGDVILHFGEVEEGLFGIEEVRSYISAQKGSTAVFTMLRGEERIEISASPRANPPEGEGTLRVPIWRAPIEGARATAIAMRELVRGFVFFFKYLASTGSAPGGVVGPVGIADIAQSTLAVSTTYFLQLIAFLSLNLAIFNVLPIPALDGGLILFFIIEKIIGRPIPKRIAGTIHSLFFLLLIALMVWVTWNDILARI